MDKEVIKMLEDVGANLTKAASIIEESSKENKIKQASNEDVNILSEAYIQCRLSGYLNALGGQD